MPKDGAAGRRSSSAPGRARSDRPARGPVGQSTDPASEEEPEVETAMDATSRARMEALLSWVPKDKAVRVVVEKPKLPPEVLARAEVLKVLRSSPEVAISLGVPKDATDWELLKALSMTRSPLDTLREGGCDLVQAVTAAELLSMALGAPAPVRARGGCCRLRRIHIFIVVVLLTAVALSAAAAWMSLGPLVGWQKGKCSISTFSNRTCNQGDTCAFEVSAQVARSWYIMSSWIPPMDVALSGRILYRGQAMRCCSMPEPVNCCRLFDDESRSYCDNWANRVDENGIACPSGNWPCLFRTTTLDKNEIVVTDLKPYDPATIWPLVVAAGALVVLLFVGLVVHRRWSAQLAQLGGRSTVSAGQQGERQGAPMEAWSRKPDRPHSAPSEDRPGTSAAARMASKESPRPPRSAGTPSKEPPGVPARLPSRELPGMARVPSKQASSTQGDVRTNSREAAAIAEAEEAIKISAKQRRWAAWSEQHAGFKLGDLSTFASQHTNDLMPPLIEPLPRRRPPISRGASRTRGGTAGLRETSDATLWAWADKAEVISGVHVADLSPPGSAVPWDISRPHTAIQQMGPLATLHRPHGMQDVEGARRALSAGASPGPGLPSVPPSALEGSLPKRPGASRQLRRQS